VRNTSLFSWKRAWLLSPLAATLLSFGPAAASETAASGGPAPATTAPAPAASPAAVVRLLIGAPTAPSEPAASAQTPSLAAAVRLAIGGVQAAPSDHAAVIRIGPPGSSFLAEDMAGEESDDPVTCMTQAIYYEARSESLEGQQAVAQVVVNRTRLSQFSSSICGVVYQRQRETSGCQFSFVCDGSMARLTDWAAWERARAVAKRALAGFVYKPMKDATHYHAAWMTPYWSPYFVKIRQIGGHVFYR